MQMYRVISLFLMASAVEANRKKAVGEEFWEAAKAIRAAEVVLQDTMHTSGPPAPKESEVAVEDAVSQLLRVSESVVAELRGGPPGKKKLALARQLNRLGRSLRLHRRQRHRHHLSARQDFSVALKSIRKAIAELKIAAWDAERRGVDSAARAAAVVVADEARRLFHLTQNMAHEEQKVIVSEHKTLPAVAAVINANLTSWNKLGQKHCRHHKLDPVGSHYGSLASAKKACEVRENCAGIYQSGCSGFHFYLCNKDYAFEDSGASCVYHKPDVEALEQAPVERAVPKAAAQKPKVKTLVAKAAAAQALAAQAKKESDSLMDEAVAEVATAARNAEEVANTVYGKQNPVISESVLEVEKASENLKQAVLVAQASRASDSKVKNATTDSTPRPKAITTTTTTTTLELISKVDDAFSKLEASFKPVPTVEPEDSDAGEGTAQQDLERLVGNAKEAPIARAFKIQEREEEKKTEQVKEQEPEQMSGVAQMNAELGNDIAEVSAPSSKNRQKLSPEEWRAFDAPESTDAAPESMDDELDAAFAPVSQEPDLIPQEHRNRLRTVAAAAQKAAEDARKEAEESVHQEMDAERPRRRFRSPVTEEDSSEPVFKPEVEDIAGIDVPVHQLAFEKAVGMTVGADVQDPDQEEESRHWHNARKHHKHKHKKHHSRW